MPSIKRLLAELHCFLLAAHNYTFKPLAYSRNPCSTDREGMDEVAYVCSCARCGVTHVLVTTLMPRELPPVAVEEDGLYMRHSMFRRATNDELKRIAKWEVI